MAILNRDEYFARLNTLIGNDTSDTSMEILEDMTDTYNHMEQAAGNDAAEWERRYHELDDSWRRRYQHRFFNGGSSYIPPTGDDETDDEVTPENITIDDLFDN